MYLAWSSSRAQSISSPDCSANSSDPPPGWHRHRDAHPTVISSLPGTSSRSLPCHYATGTRVVAWYENWAPARSALVARICASRPGPSLGSAYPAGDVGLGAAVGRVVEDVLGGAVL